MLASRKELIEYDTRVRDKITSGETSQSRTISKQLSTLSDAQSIPGRCYGCSSSATEHCVTLLKALAMKSSTRDKLIKEVKCSQRFAFMSAGQGCKFYDVKIQCLRTCRGVIKDQS